MNFIKLFQSFCLTAAFITAAVIFSGCPIEPSECDAVDCGLNGTCNVDATGNPFCLCNPGYSGAACENFDPCDPSLVECPENSTCVVDGGEAFCECNDGYEGDNCELSIRDRFIGSYLNSQDVCTSDPGTVYTYATDIVADNDDITQFIITNLGNYANAASVALNVRGRITGVDSDTGNFTWVLDRQTFGQYTFEGISTGNYNTTLGTIGIVYRLEFEELSGNVLTDECTATLAPQ